MSNVDLLAELLDDQRERWQRGETVPVEEYLTKHSDLRTDDHSIMHLLYHELLLREASGESPQLEEYLRRFPSQAERLRHQFALHHELQAGALLKPAGGDLPSIPGYEVRQVLGRGGMGIVYEARQVNLDRVVALKMIRGGVYASLEEKIRFRIEAEAIARLHHQHIVQIYDIGEHDGLPFFALEFAAGGSLRDRLAGQPMQPREAAQLAELLARAVHHAHLRGVVHRDIKPANVLLVEGQETRLACCTPKINDFGLARLLDTEGQTSTGARPGTPPYMAPEQVSGQEVGPLSDVYSLGATLYELLAGRAPFRGGTLQETLHQVLNQDPVPPSRLNPGVPRDLETICLKCLRKEPDQRYGSAEAIAEDLRRFLEDEPILARPLGHTEKIYRWCRRRPLVAGLLGAVAVLLVGVAFSGGLAANAANRAADEARLREVDQKREALLEQLTVLRLHPHRNGWLKQAQPLVKETVALGKVDNRVRGEAAALLSGVDASPMVFFPFDGSSVAFDGEGKRLVIGGMYASKDCSTTPGRIWGGSKEEDIQTSQQVGAGPVAFRSSDGAPLQVVVREGPALLVWDMAKQQAVSECRFDTPAEDKHDLKVSVLSLTADGSLLAAAASGPRSKGLGTVWETASGRVLFSFPGDVSALVFSPDGSSLAAAGTDGWITLWSVPERKPEISFFATRLRMNALAFRPGFNQLAVADAGGIVTVWDLTLRLPVAFCAGSTDGVFAVTFSPDGMLLASGEQYHVKLWQASTGRLLLELFGGGKISALAFSGDAMRLAASSSNSFGQGGVNVWTLDQDRGIRQLGGLTNAVTKLRFSREGRLLAAMSSSWQIGVWDIPRGRLLHVLPAPSGRYSDNAGLALSEDGRWLACSTYDEARLWNLDTGREAGRWHFPPGLADALAFHPSGKLLLFRGETKDGVAPEPVADYRNHPRVCRLRELLGRGESRLIREIPDFNEYISPTFAPADGSYFVGQGLCDTPEFKGRLAKAFDGLTGEDLKWVWRFTNTNGSVESLDPRGKVLVLSETGGSPLTLVEMPEGKVVEVGNRGSPSLSLEAGLWTNSGPEDPSGKPEGWALFRHGEVSPIAILGIDNLHPMQSTTFDQAGTQLAWGNGDGTVSVCNIERIRTHLREFGLGW